MKAGRILPTRENAKQVVDIVSDDLRRSGVPPGDVFHVANSGNRETVHRQQQKLLRHPLRYMGAYATGLLRRDLIGFEKINEWRVADQLPYETGLEQERLQERVEQEHHHFDSRPLGIFALGVLDTLNEETRSKALELLVRKALHKARGNEVRIGLEENDPARSLLVGKYGFQARGQIGVPTIGYDKNDLPIYGPKQELHVRPMSNL